MSNDRLDAESTVSGDRTTVPARIRCELGIDDGDRLRWHLEDDGSIWIEVVRQRTRTFDDFDGYDGTEITEVETDHDAWGVDRE